MNDFLDRYPPEVREEVLEIGAKCLVKWASDYWLFTEFAKIPRSEIGEVLYWQNVDK